MELYERLLAYHCYVLKIDGINGNRDRLTAGRTQIRTLLSSRQINLLLVLSDCFVDQLG
jgi:hypothetical protein